jgi:hypothetical protein
MYDFLVACHILLTVTWLGVDAGVFIGSHMIRNRRYDPGARYLVSRLMGYLDLGPRLSVPLVFATGLNLAYLSGWASVSGAVVSITWLVMVGWCAAVLVAFWLQHRLEAGHEISDVQRAWLRLYRRLDLWLRWLWLLAIASALISGAVVGATWLTLKVALFGIVILVGNALRLMPGTSSMALMATIHREGSTPEREDALYSRLRLTHPIVLTMYACVVAAVFLGVLKPA